MLFLITEVLRCGENIAGPSLTERTQRGCCAGLQLGGNQLHFRQLSRTAIVPTQNNTAYDNDSA